MARRNDDWMLLLLLAAVVMQGRGRPLPASSPARALTPGWWWSWVTNDEAPAYQTWWTQNRTSFAVRKTYGGTAFGVTIILIEVFDAVPWPFERTPQPAPRGADTDLTDVAGALINPPHELRQMVEQVAKKTWEYLRQLYEGTRPPPEPFPGTQ